MLRFRVAPLCGAALLVVGLSACGLPKHDENSGAQVDIVAAGDSYSTGQGSAGAYYANGDGDAKSPDDPRTTWRQGTPVAGDLGCHRNHDAAAEQLWRETDSAGSFINASCSGDVIANLTGSNVPPQLNDFDVAQREDVELITITAGGNDLHFTSIVANCFFPGVAANGPCREQQDIALDLLDASGGKSQIQSQTQAALEHLGQQFPNALVVLIGYPLIFEGSSFVLPADTTHAVFDPAAAILDGIELLNSQQAQVVDDLNDSFGEKRFVFMPLHEDDNMGDFDGHGLGGAGQDFLNDLSATPDSSEWVHPNAAGTAAMGDALRDLPEVQALFA
ncbi:MAG TPA: SGNH/GDSL hydrolase family protein [Verrucomicrobiae bacterium]|nr:SGNH/GDSL hydrolase family protein [Verrucomicrobiae bacterium]